MTAFVPNAYVTPNAFADKIMHLLTGEEWKVTSCICRHILGWRDKIEKREGAVSLSMLESGFTTQKGERYYGCGLSRPTIATCLDTLVKFKVIQKVGEPTPDGQRWRIPDDDSEIDYDALWQRQSDKEATNRKRTTKARLTTPKHKNQGGKSHLPVSPTNQSQYVPLTSAGKSHLPKNYNLKIQDQIQEDSLRTANAVAANDSKEGDTTVKGGIEDPQRKVAKKEIPPLRLVGSFNPAMLQLALDVRGYEIARVALLTRIPISLIEDFLAWKVTPTKDEIEQFSACLSFPAEFFHQEGEMKPPDFACSVDESGAAHAQPLPPDAKPAVRDCAQRICPKEGVIEHHDKWWCVDHAIAQGARPFKVGDRVTYHGLASSVVGSTAQRLRILTYKTDIGSRRDELEEKLVQPNMLIPRDFPDALLDTEAERRIAAGSGKAKSGQGSTKKVITDLTDVDPIFAAICRLYLKVNPLQAINDKQVAGHVWTLTGKVVGREKQLLGLSGDQPLDKENRKRMGVEMLACAKWYDAQCQNCARPQSVKDFTKWLWQWYDANKLGITSTAGLVPDPDNPDKMIKPSELKARRETQAVAQRLAADYGVNHD